MPSENEELLGYLKKVTLQLHDTRTQLRAAESRAHEPVAIVGMGCRYPGHARSAEQLWELVATGSDAISKFPTDRGWDLEKIYDPGSKTQGTSCTDEGGFLYDAAEFDAGFFDIGPREALMMDPQQRLLLEVSWEAIEQAGIVPSSLRGSQVGVFAGVAFQDHGMQFMNTPVSDDMRVYLGMGANTSVLSGRVAYAMGLGGAAVTVETACSSSLVALHLACNSLRAGDCSMALAGGVTVMSTPLSFIFMSLQGGVALDGRCKAFAAAADGTGFAEGAGVVLLERLADAQRLGHEVLAVIRGSAINQDGTSNGLSAPSGRAQERVIRQALAAASLSADRVDVVEAHGTGTALGDPIEAEALLATYGQGRLHGRPLWLGSLKSNIGHTQGAAGVGGVIKMVMAMRHGVMPKTLHVDEPTRQVNWTLGDVSLLTESMAWSREGEPRRAGVSSFGISGTNAHMILEEAPDRSGVASRLSLSGKAAIDGVELATGGAKERAGMTAGTDDQPADTSREEELSLGLARDGVAWVISGRSIDTLREQAERLVEWLSRRVELEPLDVGFSLATARTQFGHRAVVVGDGREQLLDGLRALAAGETDSGLVEGVAADREGQVVFVFPDRSSRWQSMALELLDCSPLFAEQVRACGEALEPFVDWSLEGVLRGGQGAPSLERVDVAQPALFAVMVSLARLWEACGVVPDAVVGRSGGEIAAGCVAGSLSLQDAARLVASSSRAPVEDSADDAAHSAFEDAVGKLLERGQQTFVEISPHAVLAMGVTETIERLRAEAEARVVVPSSPADRGARRFLSSLGEAWTQGVDIDWHRVFADSGAVKVELPTSAFQRKPYWLLPTAESIDSAPPIVPGERTAHSLRGEEMLDRPLLRRLSGVARDERDALILRVIQEQVAAVLGDISPEDIDPSKNLLELGFSSMGAVELRTRLEETAGLHIPTSVILDGLTPEVLVADMITHIDSHAGARSHADGSQTGSDTAGFEGLGSDSGRDSSVGTLTSMLGEARDGGTVDRFMEMVMAASRFRPAFDSASARELRLELVALAQGSAPSLLICLPTALAPSGPHQYVGFANALRGERTVSALTLPGFARGERLPESVEAVVEALTVSVEAHGGNQPLVLVGHSSGGWLAHAMASRLEREGPATVAAVVLLDSYPVAHGPAAGALLGSVSDLLTDEMLAFVSDDRLTAMGAYMRLFSDWSPLEIAAPTLLVKASEPLAGVAGKIDGRDWEFAYSEVEVPGSHFTMMGEHVGAVAQAVGEWLSATGLD